MSFGKLYGYKVSGEELCCWPDTNPAMTLLDQFANTFTGPAAHPAHHRCRQGEWPRH